MVGKRRSEGRGWEFVEVDAFTGIVVAGTDLPDVGGGVDEVDGDVVGGYTVGEVEELVEMAMSYERHHHHHHLLLRHGRPMYRAILIVAAHFWD
ncbi:hypothetical protein L6452_37154 [Arctium lappa]|uniref:Uncharacterized protein n=1 Tax=Arctium lappa TaxID=4217 RepID=A0ACB8Y278_ARCLA|nr:hypothetical protein L6452_37154 [Arctium lappa]